MSFLDYDNKDTVAVQNLRAAFKAVEQTPSYAWSPGNVCSGKPKGPNVTWQIVRIEEVLEGGLFSVTFVEDDYQEVLGQAELKALTEKEIEHLKLVKPTPGSIDFTKPTEKEELYWECMTTIYDDSKWMGTAENKAESKRLSAKAAYEGGTESGALNPFVPGDLPRKLPFVAIVVWVLP